MTSHLPVLLAIQTAVLALAALLGYGLGIPWWQSLAWHPNLPLAALVGVSLSLSSWLLFEWAGRLGLLDLDWFMNQLMLPLFGGLRVYHALWIAALSGLAEEALFRGVALPQLGLIGSSLLFGLLHTGDRRLLPMGLWATLVGYGLGLYWLETGDLAGCMVTHASSNLTSLIILGKKGTPSPEE